MANPWTSPLARSAAREHMPDNRQLPFLQGRELGVTGGYQPVDAGGLGVEEVGDAALFLQRGHWDG